jgi:hypothetical protein
VERDAALHHATSAPALRVELEQVDRTRGTDQSNPASAMPALAPSVPPPAGLPMLAPSGMPAPDGAPFDPPVGAGFAPPTVAPIAAD